MATYSRKRRRILPDVDVEVEGTLGLLTPPPSSPSIDDSMPANTYGKATTKSKSQPSKKVKLTQMTIDLGGNPQKKCKTCGMEYMSTSPEDAVLHKKYHAQVLSGLVAPSSILNKEARVVHTCSRKSGQLTTKIPRHLVERDDVIVEVRRSSDAMARRFTRKVLEIVEEELGAVRTDEDALWSQVHTPSGQRHDRHKAYLYLQDGVCIGFCLAEHTDRARRVAGGTKSMSVAEPTVPAQMGISRIWTSRDFRHLSIARELLEAARRHFETSHEGGLPREVVAFSQPTQSGMALARAWYGRDDGWLIYDND